MARRFHGSRFPSRASTFTSKAWSFDNQVEVLSQGDQVIVTGIEPTEGTDVTVLRNYLTFSIANSQNDFPLDGTVQIGFGIAIVSNIAFSVVGSAGVPGPLTNGDSDLWLLHHIETQVFAVGGQGAGHFGMHVESKAKRKFGDGEVMVMVIEIGTNTGTGANNIRWSLRTLLMLK